MNQLATETSTPRPSIPERHPRPEAVALGWRDMLANTREATEALIHWLTTAVEVSKSRPLFSKDASQIHTEQLATSVLIAGDRGAGKTTVMLSAAHAFAEPDHFLPPAQPGRPRSEPAGDLNQTLKAYQKSIVWMDPLDMEPLPPDANLLATLLVRVQNSLRPGSMDGAGDRASSALLSEEGLDEPWTKISQLVREASFMWEKSPAQGVDAREHVSNQIRAADTYATFQHRFLTTLDDVAKLQARRRFGPGNDTQVILVLPIDNVDRSIQHLNLILKLIRMVASPRLWFLLAAGGEEFQLFLERTFLRELGEAGQLALGDAARESSMAIARRQAAGSIRRVLPQVHRISIRPLPTREIWEFRAPKPMAGSQEDPRCIRDFLRRLGLPEGSTQPDGLKCLADLFDVRERLSDPKLLKDSPLLAEYLQHLEEVGDSGDQRVPTASAPEEVHRALLEFRTRLVAVEGQGLVLEDYVRALEEEAHASRDNKAPVFTHAAKLALSMSARTAVDLWHAARKACREESLKDHSEPLGQRGDRAIQLADQMLRMAIDESTLPSWASELFLNRILRKDSQGRIFLDLTDEPVQRLKLTTLSDALEWPAPRLEEVAEGHALRSELHLRHVMDIVLVLKDLDAPCRSVHLPAHVAGWYMLLHDLLVLTADGRVLTERTRPLDVTPPLVVTRHEVLMPHDQIVEFNFRWMLPEWTTFIDSFIFTMQWRAFLHRIRGLFLPSHGNGSSKGQASTHDCFRLILAAWIHNVCTVADTNRGQWDWAQLERVISTRDGSPDSLPRDVATRIDGSEQDDSHGMLARYEEEVARTARTLFEQTRGEVVRLGRTSIACHWLETFLPLLMKPEFLPRGVTHWMYALLHEAEDNHRRRETLGLFWQQHELLLRQRRRALVRDGVKDSSAYAQLRELFNTATDWGARECAKWLEQSCARWFGAQKDEARE